MQSKKPGLLLTALDSTIKRIETSFGEKWLYIGSVTTDADMPEKSADSLSVALNQVIQPGHHTFTEICMCVEGKLVFKAGDETLSLKQGNGVIVLPDVMHCEIPIKNQDYTVMWLVISPSKARLHLSGTRDGEFFISDFSQLKQSHEYNMLLDQIKHESKYRDNYHYLMTKIHLLRMYVISLRELQTRESENTGGTSWKETIVSEIKDVIMKNGPGHVKLRDIAKEVCISENHMNHIFKSVTGTTIANYIEKMRIDLAKQLLIESTMSIDYISSKLGYYDRYHFGKSFKKATGLSPGRYRKYM